MIQLPGGWWTTRCPSLARQLMAAIPSHSAARRLFGSPIVYTAALFAASGLGFAGANLVLARLLSTSDFALVILVMTLLNVSIPLAPAGMDGVINRHMLDLGPSLLGRVSRHRPSSVSSLPSWAAPSMDWMRCRPLFCSRASWPEERRT